MSLAGASLGPARPLWLHAQRAGQTRRALRRHRGGGASGLGATLTPVDDTQSLEGKLRVRFLQLAPLGGTVSVSFITPDGSLPLQLIASGESIVAEVPLPRDVAGYADWRFEVKTASATFSFPLASVQAESDTRTLPDRFFKEPSVYHTAIVGDPTPAAAQMFLARRSRQPGLRRQGPPRGRGARERPAGAGPVM